jgi:hypothetical protein
MSSEPTSDPIGALRETITAIDQEPETPALAALRDLLERRLHRLEAESQTDCAPSAKTSSE